MEYMNVKEAAEKWGISVRLAQRLCSEGRVTGAAKFSGSWAIPTDAAKPDDPRRSGERRSSAEKKSSKTSDATADAVVRAPMPLLNTPFKLGHCMDAIVHIKDADSRNIALCEYYYFSGRAENASIIAEKYLTHEDLAIRLSACWIYGYANLALNRIEDARNALMSIKRALEQIDDNTPEAHRALAVCVSTGASVLLHLPTDERAGDLQSSLRLLPTGLRLFALYVSAHNAYLNANYGESIGIVETALSLSPELYPIPTIYLHLVATMDYMSLRDSNRARDHLLEAWKLAKPDDLIEAFGEHHGLLGGMLEAVLKKEYPEDFKRIISITYSFSAGWRRVHNPETGANVADDLTTTEFAVAMLAARDWSNKEIGAHLGISTNTVKHHISVALQKLRITQRSEFVKFVLK